MEDQLTKHSLFTLIYSVTGSTGYWYKVTSSSDTQETQDPDMATIQNITKAVIAAFIKAEYSFSALDIVQCVNEAVGPDSGTRAVVMANLRAYVKEGNLKSLGISSKGGYGWLYYVKSPMVPSGCSPRGMTTAPAKKTKAPTKTSQEWLTAKGWTMPEEGMPTGWDLGKFYESFYVEKITEEEFKKRWNYSYDPAYKVEVPKEKGEKFLSTLQGFLNMKTAVSLDDTIQQYCLDKPEIESLATKLGLQSDFPNWDKKAWIDQAESCSTIGELLALACDLSK